MNRDYKPSTEKPKNSSKGSPLLTGLLVGVLLGVIASLGVVMYIKGGTSPFTNKPRAEQGKSVSEKIAEDVNANTNTQPLTENSKPDDNNADETRFDFYTILPGSEHKGSKEENKVTDVQSTVPKTYFLQVGAFHTEEEADNLKAKLALQGFEAVVQTITTSDKGVWHRVRVGPLNDLDQINKTKSDLVSNGFKADLIN